MARRGAWFRSARARSTIAATAVVAAALVTAGFTAVVLQRRSLISAIDTSLVARVDDLGALVESGTIPRQIPVRREDDALVQIIDERGAVLGSSANIDGEGPIADLKPARDTQTATTEMLPIGESRFRLVARSIISEGGIKTVYAAASLEPVDEAVGTLSAILIVGIPALIGLVAVTVWLIVGRTLQPVESIRSQVAAITERELDRRVPVPPVDDEVGRLAVTMNRMLDRLQHASVQQRRFIADASHELRSPLAAIRSQLEVDLTYPDLADRLAAGADLLDEIVRMQRIVDDLLLLARSDSGTLSTRREAVDLDDLVFAEVKRAAGTGVLIDTGNLSGAQVAADTDQIARMLRNLFDNALRHARHRISVALTEHDATAVFVIEDDGPGIAAEDRERVFGRFTRLDEGRDRDHGGAGLGLAIAREIVHHHSGTIHIDESPLGGARFTVKLPTGAPDAPAFSPAGRDHAPAAEPDPARGETAQGRS